MAVAIALNDREDHSLLLNASMVGDSATIGPDRLSHIQELALYVVFSKEAMGGRVIIEGAHLPGYPGRWVPLGDVEWVSSDAVEYRAVTGVHLAIRVRITEAPVGGAISVYGIAN
jgi:hypothetical protein